MAAVGAAALLALGCAACDDSSSSAPTGGSPASRELNGIQSTLDSIQSDINGDGAP